MSKQKQSFLAGAIIISVGGFVSKLLGAVYRIPLTNILGGEGMGIYQMVYPLYCILLTVSASGIPTGISRLISSGRGAGAERQAFRLYGAVGVIGMLIMFVLSAPLAALQTEPAIKLCCQLLCPSVFFVSLLSVVRGYFQGKGNMLPTATTEIMEQVIKVAFGVAFSYLFRGNLPLAVASTLLAVTISEIISTGVALLWYFKKRSKPPLYRVQSVPVKSILRFTVPLTLTAIALPVSQLFESIIAVRLLRAGAENATALYGVFSGCAITIINLPVSITYGLAASSVPQISPLAESGDMAGAKKKAFKSLAITLAVSLPAAVGLYFLAPLATRLIFGSLQGEEKELLISLIKILAVSSVTQSLVQTSSACLTAMGYPVRSTVTQWTTAFLRVGLTAGLIAFTNLSISGAAWSANCAYFVAMVMNFCYIIMAGKKPRGKDKSNENNADWIGGFKGRLNAGGAPRA
ncbi:MAG: polysaccharide biosynthesis protein [Clostridia bacterium]|jgi:stage V sporulation protein B|nr:polysaccharide biosynthesis protein [Clostridia bacterium]